MNDTNALKSRILVTSFLLMVSIFSFIIIILYNITLQQKKNHLSDFVRGEVLIIESMIETHQVENPNIFKKNITTKDFENYFLKQLIKIHSNSNTFNKTGEIVLGRKADKNIELLLKNRFDNSNTKLVIDKNETFAEPMRRALNGDSGVIVAKDYRGEKVLAAYKAISDLNIGLVAKIDIKELREPFVIVGIFSVILSLLIVIVGYLIYTKIRNPSLELLKRKENKYREIFDIATDMLFLLSKSHKIIEENKSARKKYHYSESELLGRDFKDLIFSKYHKQFNQTLTKTFIGLDVKLTSRHITSLGDTFPVEVHITPISFEEEEALLVSVRDISKRIDGQKKNIKLEAQLSQSEKLASIGQLAAGVAHEINNPMGFINSNLNTMNKYLWKIKKYLSEMKLNNNENSEEIDEIITDFGDAISESLDGSERVKKIVADLKGFARSDNKFEFVNINEGIASTLNIVHNQLKYHCEIQEELQDIPDVYCIRGKINQVIMNLLVNAGQAIKENGLITIKTWSELENVFISIKDNGIGIPKDKLNQIYDPFYTSKEVGVGTGLGLSVVYDIIKKHEGTIDVVSKVGVGTEFIITIPHKNDQYQNSDIIYEKNSITNNNNIFS